jgi:hypothetical protein
MKFNNMINNNVIKKQVKYQVIMIKIFFLIKLMNLIKMQK